MTSTPIAACSACSTESLAFRLDLNTTGKLKPRKFEEKASRDDFYLWTSLRSFYLTEANVDAARRYAGGFGWVPGGWYGDGWYWEPWFDAYTFIAGEGSVFDPFGWCFYSPCSGLGRRTLPTAMATVIRGQVSLPLWARRPSAPIPLEGAVLCRFGHAYHGGGGGRGR